MMTLSAALLAPALLWGSAQVDGARAPAQDAAPALSEGAQERFDALTDEVAAATEAWYAEIQEKMAAAEKAGGAMPAISMTPPSAAFVPKFQAAATEYAGTEDAVPFLVWLAREDATAGAPVARGAIETLLAHHVASPRLEPLAEMLPYMGYQLGEERAKEVATRLAAAGAPVVRGWATLTLVSPALDVAEVGTEDYAALKKRLLDGLEGVESPRLRQQVEMKLRVKEVFGIGMTAPDIVGVDLDGTAFKLSDYAGKVVFLDFWGDW